MMNLVVAGGGEGTYGKLWNSILSKDPNLGMRLAAVIDVKEQSELHPRMQEIICKEGAVYAQLRSGTPLDSINRVIAELRSKFRNPVAIVMTPNDSHLYYASLFTRYWLKTFLEKPAATRLVDIPKLRVMNAARPGLLYGAEFRGDGKALGLLFAAGVLKANDLRMEYLNFSITAPVAAIFLDLGKLVEIEGQLLEGEGTAGTADHRAWLLDGRHGGMIRDLASHLFAPLYDARLITGKVVGAKVTLGKWEKEMPLGTYRPLRAPEEGETYADIRGKFTVPGGATVPFRFRVGKYWTHHDRALKLTFEYGYAELSYEKPYVLRIETWNHAPASVWVTADPYTLTLLDFKKFVEGKRDGHVRRALAIVKFNEKMRARGIASLL